MSMTESAIKRKMIASIKEAGGYARRIEDQYAVGMVDTILIPRGLPVFMAEVKKIHGSAFGPTPRQLEELRRIKEADYGMGHVIPIMIGHKDDTYYFHAPANVIKCSDCFSVTTSKWAFVAQLVQYYHSGRWKE